MSKQVQLRRGTTAQHAAFTGAAGEVTYDTDRKCLVVHDGVTAGGLPLAGFDPLGLSVARLKLLYPVRQPAALTYAPALVLSFKTGEWQTVALTGDVTLSLGDMAAGSHLLLLMSAGNSQRTLNLPAGWHWLGSKPTALGPLMVGLLELWSWDGTESGVVARWAAET
jgi:hypothetical protein